MNIKERNLSYDKIIEMERGTDLSYHSFNYSKEIGRFSEENLLRVIKILNLRDDSDNIINYLYEVQQNKGIVEKVKNKMLKIKEKKEKEIEKLESLKQKNIIDGKKLSLKIYDELKEEIEKLEVRPSLKIILVGSNPSSLVYVNQKKKKAEYIGMDYEKISFDDNVTEKELLYEIEILNNDKNIDGFMIQLPLPEHIDERKVINSINPKKDVDGFHPENQGKINLLDDSGLQPCTPSGILELLESIDINVKGKIVTVIGKSNIVGTPISIMLSKMGATVISCDEDTPDIYKFTKDSDIVISATGVIGLIKAEHIRKDSVIIDVGITKGSDGKLYGDCDFDSIIKSGAKITSVPGGVGPMTVAMLMKNTLKAYKNNNK